MLNLSSFSRTRNQIFLCKFQLHLPPAYNSLLYTFRLSFVMKWRALTLCSGNYIFDINYLSLKITSGERVVIVVWNSLDVMYQIFNPLFIFLGWKNCNLYKPTWGRLQAASLASSYDITTTTTAASLSLERHDVTLDSERKITPPLPPRSCRSQTASCAVCYTGNTRGGRGKRKSGES